MAAQALAGATVVHKHVRHGGTGTLEVSEDGIAFEERGAHAEHSRVWKYEEIQQLVLSQTTLRVLTYEDREKWGLGRDREFVFEALPQDFATNVYAMWRDKLDQRFVAAMADPEVATLVEFPAKLRGLTKGVQGVLLFGEDRIVFRAVKAGDSRTWRFGDLENIASAGPFDFSLVAFDRGSREFRFQLQRPMEEARFNELWRRVNGRK